MCLQSTVYMQIPSVTAESSQKLQCKNFLHDSFKLPIVQYTQTPSTLSAYIYLCTIYALQQS